MLLDVSVLPKKKTLNTSNIRDCCGHDRMMVGFTTTCAISAITTKVVSSNPIHGEVYSIHHYVIKFVSDLWQVSGFLQVLRFFSTNKTDRHWNIVESGVKHHKLTYIKHLILNILWMTQSSYDPKVC
jgi:hypothetical protein